MNGDPDVGLVLPQYGRGYDEIRAVARDAEDLGFDAVWLEDHLQSWIGDRRRETPECWTTLSALAADTDEIGLGTLVTNQSFRHPSLLAKMAATVDRVSGGRLELGLGAGWYHDEYARYGFEFREPPVERIRRLRETAEILRGLWTEETYSLDGEYYELDGAFCEPRPAQDPHPPIWFGGGGEKFTMRYAAELADGWNYGTLTPAEFADKIAVLREHCERAGRDPDEIETSAEVFAFVGDSAEAAAEKKRRFADRYLADEPSEPREFFLAGYLDTALVGTPAEVRAGLESYAEAGLDTIMAVVPDAPDDDSLRLLGDELA